MEPGLPNLFIAGAPKGGTTALYRYLEQMPGFCMSRPKEPRFFDAPGERTISDYASYFSHFRGEETVGDATPTYLYATFSHQRMADTCPDAKIILCLRDPVLRAFSGWWMFRMQGKEKLPFRAAIEAEIEQSSGVLLPATDEGSNIWQSNLRGIADGKGPSHRTYFGMGLYAEQIKALTKHFALDRIYVVDSARLRLEPETTLANILDFLGHPPLKKHVDLAPRHEALPPVARPLAPLFKFGVHQWLPSGLRRQIRRSLQRVGPPKPNLSSSDAEFLATLYAAPNQELASLLGAKSPEFAAINEP